MNQDYFVCIWEGNERKEIIMLRTEEQFFEFLQNNKDKKISIYKAECVLDWS